MNGFIAFAEIASALSRKLNGSYHGTNNVGLGEIFFVFFLIVSLVAAYVAWRGRK